MKPDWSGYAISYLEMTRAEISATNDIMTTLEATHLEVAERAQAALDCCDLENDRFNHGGIFQNVEKSIVNDACFSQVAGNRR